MFIDVFIDIFTETCISLVPVIPVIIGIWLIFDLISGLIFKGR